MSLAGFTGNTQFQFTANINLRSGPGSALLLARELEAFGARRPFIIIDPGVHACGACTDVLGSLEAAGIQALVFTAIEPNPRDTTIHTAFEQARQNDCDSVVGIGGGSAMDAAKGVAVLLSNGGQIQDYDGINKVGKDLPPVIAIPTTAGTGSEVTANSALTRSKDHYKMSLRSPRLLPRLAILDPTLLRSLPHSVAATSGMDALTHAIEGYLSVRASPMSDLFALEAIRLIAAHLRPFVANPENAQAASQMLTGSMLAGLVISNTGTGNDHALARALGGLCDIAHGTATALLLPQVLAFNAIAQPERMRHIAQAMGLSTAGSAREISEWLVQDIDTLLDELHIPRKLSELGVQQAQIPDLVQVALKNVGPNPRRTNAADLERILRTLY